MIEGIRAILRARRAGLLRLRPVQGPIRLSCPPSVCGLCCSTMGGGIVVTKAEASFLPRLSLIEGRKVITLKSTKGSCSQLKGKKCECYDVRPRGCSEYPWYSLDGKLYYDSGCPGIKQDRDDHPMLANLTDIGEYLPVHSRVLSSLMIWLLKRW